MQQVNRLKREARAAAYFRGHLLSKFKTSIRFDGKGTQASAYCENCGKGVVVNSRPAPNDIDISGEAVALTCPKTEWGR